METNCNCNCGLTKKYWHTSDKVENQFNYCGSKFYKTCTNRMFLSGTRGTWYWSKYHADTQLCCISVPHQWVSWSNQQNFPRSPSGPCKKISLPYYTVVDFINCLIIKHHNPPLINHTLGWKYMWIIFKKKSTVVLESPFHLEFANKSPYKSCKE